MSATADKARYFLEQSVPELREYERKKIFSPEEITSIAKKRSDFEHKINARGSSPSDYAQYAEFEINVDNLRTKRIKRLGVKSTAHNGQRRIHFVFDRGTRKFPGDVGLWMQSIEYAKKQKAYKKLTQIFTNVLRLHPSKSELWIYASQFAIEEHGDMTEARSCMQRGLRFCKNDRTMWIEYARLELAFMAKIYARRQVLGVDQKGHIAGSGEVPEEENQDVMHLPIITAEDIDPDLRGTTKFDQDALKHLDDTPVMSGAIPQAIFDAAMSHFCYDAALGLAFFELFASFTQLVASSRMLDHALATMETNTPNAWQTSACIIARPLTGVSHNQPQFPALLREIINRLRKALSGGGHSPELSTWLSKWIESQMDEEMDPALRQVMSAQLQKLEKPHES